MTDWQLLADEQAFRTVVLDDDRPVVVAFEPDPCRACRDQRTLLSLLWRQLGWSVGAGRVLTDRTPQLGERYGIAFYPTLAVFWRGELVDRLPGPRHPDGVNRRLAALLHPPEEPAAPVPSLSATPEDP